MNYVSKKMSGKTPYEPLVGDFIIRLDANESPLSLTSEVLDMFADEMQALNINRYPDPASNKIREAFAKKFDLCADNIVAGNGSDELISVIMTSLLDKGDTLCVAYPDFSMYAFYADLSENQVLIYNKGENFTLDKLSEFVNQNNARAVIFSNPCNPTGDGFGRTDVIRFIENTQALCIIDEAYMDFWDQSILDVADKYENLIVLKTLSKAYGAAGIRLGFAIGHKSLINALNVARSPYNVNTLSQTLGKIILENMPDNSKYLANQAKKLEAKIAELLPDAKITPTKTNFVYFSHPDAKKIYEGLLKQKIAIRYFMPDRLRITASTDEELRELYIAIKNII